MKITQPFIKIGPQTAVDPVNKFKISAIRLQNDIDLPDLGGKPYGAQSFRLLFDPTIDVNDTTKSPARLESDGPSSHTITGAEEIQIFGLKLYDRDGYLAAIEGGEYSLINSLTRHNKFEKSYLKAFVDNKEEFVRHVLEGSLLICDPYNHARSLGHSEKCLILSDSDAKRLKIQKSIYPNRTDRSEIFIACEEI